MAQRVQPNDSSDAAVARAIEQDMVATRLHNTDLPLEAHDEADASWAVAPHRDILRSVVVRAEFTPANADRRVDEVVSAFEARGNGVVWWLAPFHTPPDLDARLLRRGLVHVADSPAMALDLAALPTEPDPPIERFRIEPIRDEEAFRAYLRVVGADRPEGAPPLPPGTADLMVRHVVPSLGREAVPGRFLGRLDGRPVATSRLSSAAGVAGLYSVVTLAEARGRGIGRAMTLAALYAGRDAGLTIATLQSSDMGLAIYRRLGFREVFRYGIYVRYPPGSDAPA